MKKLLLSIVGIFVVGFMSAQTFPYVDINQIVTVSQMDLQNCNDSSFYLGDTVITRGIVVTDGNLSETASGSIQGGSRPFIAIQDTSTASNGSAAGAFQGALIMGAFNGIPNSNIENALAGDIIEITARVNEFNGMLQLEPISANAVTFVGIAANPTPVVVPVSDLQDNMRINQLPTGEQWQASYVEIQNVTVTGVSSFSSGGRNRVEFTVEDAAGNRILVADRYLPMIQAGQPTVNPNSPDTAGSFVTPSIGTVYNHIRGIIVQDENGPCYPNASGFAGGYEINPVYAGDFDKAASPANISGVTRSPRVPDATQSVTVTADIIDNDGTVQSATLFYSADQTASAQLFTSVTMSNTSGSIYSATIPAFPLDSVIRYFIVAVDDSMNVTTSPNSPIGGPLRTDFYTVRANGITIMDIQTVQDVSQGDSPYNGDTVTVTGIVTASFQPGDLGFLYIQDPTANQFSGIYVNGGPVAVFAFNRGDEVTVTGVVEENFGFTRINATNAVATGNTGTITPVVLDPSDANLFSGGSNLEPYESMLLSYQNPNGNVWISNPNIGFGEYTVGSGFAPSVDARILAGRQVNGQAQGSFSVSYLSDTAAFGDGSVPKIPVQTNFNFTSIEGILYWAFGNYKLTPRDNMDYGNFTVSVATIENTEVKTSIYPNPAQDRVNIQLDEAYKFNQISIELFDMTGRLISDQKSSVNFNSLDLSGLNQGIYLIKISNEDELIHSSKLILK